MNLSKKTISLLCTKCNARGTAVLAGTGDVPHYRHQGLERLSRGFKYVDRGEKLGSFFECVACKAKVKEF